jgi:type IV secretory pathway TrbD component
MNGHLFHKSSFRPQLVLGCERIPVLLLLLICITVVVTGLNLVSFIVAAVLWFCIYPLLRRAAKSDPQMLGVWWRYKSYRGFIPGLTSPFRGKL